MHESVTYQAILDEGRVEGRVDALQQMLLRLGRKRFGRVSKAMQTALQGITDVSHLERLTDRILDVSSWNELLRVR